MRNGAHSLRALVIQHEQSAPGGHVHPWLEERGADQDVFRIDTEQRAISPRHYELIISLGSESAASDDTIPWLPRERELLRQATDAGVPVLGICFGGQLLARVLGGQVVRGERPEIGWLRVSSRDSSLVGAGPWFQWHFDAFTLPPGARLVAQAGASVQAYAHGRSLGLQFHPEATPEMVTAWAAGSRDELDQGGVDPDRLLEQTHQLAERSRTAAWGLFDAFLERVGAVPESRCSPVNLSGATALVTGANRGIGRALVERLAAEPVRLVLAGVRSVERFQAPATSPPGAVEVRPVRMDLSSQRSIDACGRELGDELGRIDLLFNNAGLVTGGLLEGQDMDQVYAMFQVNLVAVAHLTQLVLPGMLARRSGTIVNNASISGYAHFPAATTYAASKAGVVALTESLRRELRGTGVQAMHLITPGVATDMLEATEEIYGEHLDISGWGKIGAAQWAAQAVEAVKADRRVLNPGGKARLAILAARGPAWLLDQTTARVFSRAPRR